MIPEELNKLSDDKGISNAAVLWRRITPVWIVPDKNTGTKRVSSAAFYDSPDGSPLSMILAEKILASRTPQEYLINFPGLYLASITAGTARDNHQRVAQTGKDKAHISVIGDKTQSVRKALAKAAVWVVNPV
ncbi:MAG: hypothetical protein PHQ23_10560 [Candidatus Wallbacteria bacterium]|nr:hypothetical protein [Candidatus Wallbacteria bacterium]